MSKLANSHDEAWTLQDIRQDKPHGWIQWKGTNVCMDIHCRCGEISHIDAEFCYYVKCPYCNTVYFCNGHIEFIRMAESANVEAKEANK